MKFYNKIKLLFISCTIFTLIGCSQKSEQPSMLRPQTPVEPFPYLSQDTSFFNTQFGINLAGTLTIPEGEGPFPAAILISGSGAQNRNEELFGHQTFLILSDYLTRNGIAVLRYDDRGTALSEGNYAAATTVDLATDTKAALNFLKSHHSIDSTCIGLIGHSEGATIAAITASQNNEIGFIVSLGGAGVPGKEISLRQTSDMAKMMGASKRAIKKSSELNNTVYDIIINEPDNDIAYAKAEGYLRSFFQKRLLFKRLVNLQLTAAMSTIPPESLTWLRYFLKTDPAQYWKQVKCPVLALNGNKDLQVAAEVNIAAIEKALTIGGNNNVTAITLDSLNHLFQPCKTGMVTEYIYLEQTFSEKALTIIGNWINSQYRASK